jgi:hypothetical protein
VICQYCQHPIQRVGFCGVSPIWEHIIPLDERHGPYPRTLCSMDGDRHATPFFEQLITDMDQEFLRGLGILP